MRPAVGAARERNERLARGLGNQLHCTATLRAQIIIDHALRSLLAAAAAASDRQLVLDVKKRACTPIDSFADVFISDRMTDADVHPLTSLHPVLPDGSHPNWE